MATPPTTSDTLDVTEFVVNRGHGIKCLVDMGLESLPEQYIQPHEERLDMTKVVSEESIPIIDISNWDDPKVTESICDAASKRGFFQIINHGVPIEVLENVKDVAHRFFELPVEERRKCLKNCPAGIVRLATSFSPQVEKVLEWKDYLSLIYVSEDVASAFWPPICRDQVLEYVKSVELVITRVLEALLTTLDVKEIEKTKEYLLMGSIGVSLNYYPACPNPELTAGVGRHSDASSITILLQDDIGGLYVRGGIDGDSWIHVPPVNGALVVNVGDVLQILSNDRYKSIEHRAIANRSKSRVSIPVFFNPKSDAFVGPLPEVLESGEKPKYRQVLYSDYFKHFFSKGHDGKKTLEFAKI